MNDSERVELNELCSAAVDGALSDTGRERLQQMLRESAEARQFYVRATRLSASLYSYAAEMQSEPVEPMEVAAPAWRRWMAGIAAAAALIMVGVAVFRSNEPAIVPVVPDDEWVARLTGTKECVWDGAPVASGEEILVGQHLQLTSGVAELTFDSGAQLLVQGPARLSVRSAWEAELHRGTVKANVPTEAIGFRVINAAVEVVDLGTEFSVSAHEDGSAEVFVLKGEVEVHPRDAAGNRRGMAVLKEKQAKRFAKAGAGEIRDREEKFARLMQKVAIDRMAKPLNYTRWSFDEGKGTIVHPAGSVDAALPLSTGTNSQWVSGKFGSALALEGTVPLSTGLMPPLRRGIRSVAFWARPNESFATRPGPILVFPGPKALPIEIGTNASPADGAFGALRMDIRAGTAVAATPLREGRWQHIAVVLGALGNADKPAMKLYVDGRLEPLSGRHAQRRSLDRFPEEALLWVGGSPKSSRGFVGALDELVLAEQPLTPQEIRHLIRTNQLVSPAVLAGM